MQGDEVSDEVSNEEQRIRGVVECLRAAPALASFVQGSSPQGFSWQGLAQSWEEDAPLSAEQTLAGRPAGVRLVVSGGMRLVREGQVLPDNYQYVGRGVMVGLHVLVRRFYRRELEQWVKQPAVAGLLGPARVEWVLGVMSGARNLASDWFTPVMATEETRLLWLREEALEALSEPLREHLLRVYQANLLAEHLVSTMGQEPRLANVSEWALFRLVEGAALEAPEQPLQPRREKVPSDFHVLLVGRCRISFPEGSVATVKAMACLNVREFILEQPFPGDARLLKQGEDPLVAVRIGREALNRLMREEPGFRQAVIRGNPELLPQSKPAVPHQVLMLDGKEELLRKLSPRLLVDCLKQRLAEHLHEHVRVVHVKADSIELVEPTFKKVSKDTHGWVLEESRALKPPQASARSRLLSRPDEFGPLSEQPDGVVNVVLVEAFDLDREERKKVLEHLAREMGKYPDEPLRLLYLGSEPADFPSPHELPTRVELLPCAVLGDTLPGGVGLPLGELLARSASMAQRLNAARRALSGTRQVLEAMARYLKESWQEREQKPTWPDRTVRLRLLDGSPRWSTATAAQLLQDGALRETFDRWARAATHRLVGLALGGGGAFGYAHVPLMLELLDLEPTPEPGANEDTAASERRVPIDLVSGSSFGSIVGAFFCVAGPQGLRAMTKHWELVSPIAVLSVLSSVGMQWWLDGVLGPAQLEQLEVPLFPVVADADVGVEWDIRKGTIGFGVRASGSMPPIFAPTIQGNRRFLDGGILANVPVNVLRQAGANMLIASNPISQVPTRSRRFPRVPVLGALWRQLNPVLRTDDTFRMLRLLGRTAGESQSGSRDVLMYSPQHTSAWLDNFHRSQQIVLEASEGVELGLVLIEARARWRAMLNNPRDIVRVDPDNQTVDLDEDVIFDHGALSRQSQRGAIQDLVVFLDKQQGITGFKLVVSSLQTETVQQQAQVLSDYLKGQLPAGRQLDITCEGRARQSQVTGRVYSRVRLEKVTGLSASDVPGLTEQMTGQAVQEARARKLALSAEYKARTGEPGVARELALEAARSEPPLMSARALREVLELRGALERSFEASTAVTALAWSPRRDLLAAGYWNGALRLWDVAQGRLAWEGKAHPDGTNPSVMGLVWSPAGDALYSRGNDSRLKLWTCQGKTLKEVGSLEVKHHDDVPFVCSPDGAYLLGPSGAGSVDGVSSALFRPVVGKGLELLAPGDMVQGRFTTAAWAPGTGNLLATAGEDRVTLWEAAPEGPRKLHEREVPGARALAWKSDGQALLVGARGACLLWRVSRSSGEAPKVRQWKLSLHHEGAQVSQVAWSADERRMLAVLPAQRSLHVWDSRRRLHKTLQGESVGSLMQVQAHPALGELALTWGNEAAWVWNLKAGQRIARLGGHLRGIAWAGWEPGGSRMATVGAEGNLQVWGDITRAPTRRSWAELEDPAALAPLRTFEWPRDFYLPEQGTPIPVHEQEAGDPLWAWLSPDQRRKVVPVKSPEGTYTLRPDGPALARVLAEQRPWDEAPLGVRWSPQSHRVALREPNRVSIWSWEGADLELLKDYKVSDVAVRRLAWDPSGRWLVIGLSEAPLLLWDVDGDAAPVRLEGAIEKEGVWDCAWHPRERLLAVACQDRCTRIYSLTEGPAVSAALVMVLETPHPIKRLAWNPVEELLASSDESGSVSIWYIAEGEDLAVGRQTLRDHGKHLIWNSQGTLLFSADEQGRALVWQAQNTWSWEVVSVLEYEPVPSRWAAFSNDSSWLAVMENDGQVRFHPVLLDTLVDAVKSRRRPTLRVVARDVR